MRKETSSRKSPRKSSGSSAAKPRRRTEAPLGERLLDSMKELRSLQDWQQGRRRPEIPIRANLAVIQRDPQAVIRALRAA
jgi:hypothetical protein